jgi:broad specificity phosphatase PhoE
VTEFLLVRHGESEWNREGRWQGHADPPLSDEGRRQARALAETLAPVEPTAVYTSDLARARETGEIVAERLGLPLRAMPALREIDVGEWQGLTRAEIEERYPGAADRGWEQGETQEELAARVLPALLEISRDHPRDRVVVVAHGGPVRTVAAQAAGLSALEHRRLHPSLGHCELFRVACRDGVFRRID